ncbi:orotidine-5'-phosphate decarboxylase [Brucepastera parasyntrophica]|uniref:orotidine-5'-phosphate decarboxylase n=1 Tax=Brucepastera parasyntrophica TaxID=2880008 RepID=UPI00210E96EA|nr:orotidine-5'-phosphate decarboxylase [Brucepastera parasyntrophica]ULQ60807.1 orotidine-5'-phosphate decarboxylase [Brucepastera parasyntrophica]
MDKKAYEMTRLQALCSEKGPLCIGLDTDPSYIPPEILRLHDSPAQAVLAYNRALISETARHAACFKVQIAYYEAMGIEGLSVYSETLKTVRSAGIPVIADIKRGDIADTAKAYARAHFSGDFEADIITLNPYMGFDTLAPFLEFVGQTGKGIFVLLKTSNPGMKDIEWLRLDPEHSREVRVLDVVGSGIENISGRFGQYLAKDCSPVGVVVGCTDEEEAEAIRSRYPNLFFLIPGYGSQGGVARIAALLLGRAGGTVNSSRGILCAWQKDPSLSLKMTSNSLTLDDIVESAARAAFNSKAELTGAKKTLAGG